MRNEVRDYGMQKGFYRGLEWNATDTLAWAGWRNLSRPRRCKSHFVKMVDRCYRKRGS